MKPLKLFWKSIANLIYYKAQVRMAVAWIHTLFSFSVPRTGTIAEPSNIPFDGTLSSNDRKGHQRGILILVSTTVGGRGFHWNCDSNGYGSTIRDSGQYAHERCWTTCRMCWLGWHSYCFYWIKKKMLKK
jgi:hypothetical protein